MATLRRTHRGRSASTETLVRQIAGSCRPLRSPADLDPLLHAIGEARFVLLGEASHGTSEYYTWRTEISRRLITEKGFSFIAVEGDWPDCYRVNRFVKGWGDGGSETAREALHAFARWPTWMWANHEVVALIEWLAEHNRRLPEPQRAGFYGLDVYSLWDSLYQVLVYLGEHDPSAQSAARRAFQCFEPYGEDSQSYARATRWVDRSCEDEVVSLLRELRRVPATESDGSESHFNAEQNALVLKNAEEYYRTMLAGGPESWNIRDHHMTETLERLMRHYGSGAKAIVWEHNTHIGDARFTDMAESGMVNVGQLVRLRYRAEGVVLVGFSSHRGSVIAGREWEAPMQRMRVPPAEKGSWEDVLHAASDANSLLLSTEIPRTPDVLEPRGHRAIGVVYRPESEWGNYVPTILPLRYDALISLDSTQAVHPLHEVHPEETGEVPETYPVGV